MNSTEKKRRALVMAYAAEYRRKFIGDDEIFYPMEHVDFELTKDRKVFAVGRDEIFDNDISIPARVRFFDSGRVVLEYSERTGRGAAAGLPSDRFAISHEIAHVNLHRRQMRDKIDGAGRNFTEGSMKHLHHQTAGMENEAHIYGGLLMIPLAKINSASDYLRLSADYNAPPNTAKQLRWNVMEVWSVLQKVLKDRGF